jgi:butyrate kinase
VKGASAPFRHRVFAVNPGSTSTKLAFFEDETARFTTTLPHSAEALAPFAHVADQYEMRAAAVKTVLTRNSIDLAGFDAVVGRGGLLRPVESGTYAVDRVMLEELRSARHGEHASNLGAPLADALAAEAGCPAFIVDPVVVDEMDDVARISGLPELPRRSVFHALNQKAVARAAAADIGRPYSELSLVVAHLGGGISVGAHLNGRVVDVNNALDGDGPFSPERAGGLPAGALVDLCFSGTWSKLQIRRKITGMGGMVAHLGINDLREARSRISAGDADAGLVVEAMAYQAAKQIGAMAAALSGRVDALVFTGGLAAEDAFLARITAMTGWIARVLVYPGEQEMLSLALGALRVLRGHETAKSY